MAIKDKGSRLSTRGLAIRLGIHNSTLVKVLGGQRHLSESAISLFADYLKMEGRDREYFIEMVAFGKAKSDSLRQIFLDRMISLGYDSRVSLLPYQYRFYQRWYYSALRSCLEYFPFDGQDYKSLGAHLAPAITAREAQEGVHLLESLQLIRWDESVKRYQLTNEHISTGRHAQSPEVLAFHKDSIKLGIRSVDEVDPTLRDISAICMAIRPQAIPALKAIIRDFQRQVVGVAEQVSNPECVYQLNVQLIPLTEMKRD
jgi:uncharacterized protein (TIGR02147 family)